MLPEASIVHLSFNNNKNEKVNATDVQNFD